MKCFCQFLNTLSFEINHSIYSFYFTEKNAVFFTEVDRSNETFVP